VGSRFQRFIQAAALGAVVLASALPTASASAQGPHVATPREVRECMKATAAVAEKVERGEKLRADRSVAVDGCAVDNVSGVADVRLEWSSDSDEQLHGLICEDPPNPSRWVCVWDTADLPEGEYTLTTVAVDAAGNEGRFERALVIEHTELPAVEPRRPETVQPPAAEPPQEPAPEPEPQSEEPGQSTDPAPPADGTPPDPGGADPATADPGADEPACPATPATGQTDAESCTPAPATTAAPEHPPPQRE
jgi:hypothetical protein